MSHVGCDKLAVISVFGEPPLWRAPAHQNAACATARFPTGFRCADARPQASYNCQLCAWRACHTLPLTTSGKGNANGRRARRGCWPTTESPGLGRSCSRCLGPPEHTGNHHASRPPHTRRQWLNQAPSKGSPAAADPCTSGSPTDKPESGPAERRSRRRPHASLPGPENAASLPVEIVAAGRCDTHSELVHHAPIRPDRDP